MLEFINNSHSDALGRMFFDAAEKEFKDDEHLTVFKISGATELDIATVNLFNKSIAIHNSIKAVEALLNFPAQVCSMDHDIKGISPAYIETHCIDITDQHAVISLIEGISDQLFDKSRLASKGISRSNLKLIIASDMLAALYLNKYKEHRTIDSNSFADWNISGTVDKRIENKIFISLKIIAEDLAYGHVANDVLSFGTHFNDRVRIVRQPDSIDLHVRSMHVINLPILASINIDQK